VAQKVAAHEVKRGDTTISQTPFHIKGAVKEGFGRGSKQIGIPTANIATEPYKDLLLRIPAGIYYGWASVGKGEVHPMAMSIGWNPYFKNQEKTIEIHVCHEFKDDFYGEEIKAIATGYIRPELDFVSLEDLTKAIEEDIQFSIKKCQEGEGQKHKGGAWLSN